MSNIRWWKHVSAIIRRYHVPRSYAERIARYPQYARDIIYEYKREKRRRYYMEKAREDEAIANLKRIQMEEEAKLREDRIKNQIKRNRLSAIKRRLEITDNPQEYKRLKTLEFVYENRLDEGIHYLDFEKKQDISWDNKNREIIIETL